MPRWIQWLFGISIAILLVGAPIGYANYRQATFRNFRTVRADVLYRSGQLGLGGLKRVINDYAIRTVITLRDAAIAGETPPDIAEEEFCRKEDYGYLRITPRSWWKVDGKAPVDQGVRRFLEIMDDPENYPVLIHCFAGTHRSGAYCAIYRMEYEHWSNAEAIDELKASGYCNLDEEQDILNYLETYQPRWRRSVAKDR